MYATYDDFSRIRAVESDIRAADYSAALGYMDGLSLEIASATKWIKDFLQNRVALVAAFDASLYSGDSDTVEVTVEINGVTRRFKNDSEAWDQFYRSIEGDDFKMAERVNDFTNDLDVDDET